MKKHFRSRVLAVGVAGALLAGGSLPLIPLAVAHAEGQPSAEQLLARGQSLLSQGQYETAKKLLLGINPSSLTPAERTSLEGLLEKADVGLAASAKSAEIYRNAQMSLQDGHLAHAVRLYNLLISDPSTTPAIRRESQDNLALAQAKQQELAGSMKQLLQKAQQAYNAGQYDQAEADLFTIRTTGADLGSDNALPAQYEAMIAQKRVAAVEAIQKAQTTKLTTQQQAQQTAKRHAAMEAQAAKQAAEAKAQQQAAAIAAQQAAQKQAQAAAAAAAAKNLAVEKAAAAAALLAHQQQIEQQLAQQQTQEEAKQAAQRQAAAVAALAAEKKAQQQAAEMAARQKAAAAALAQRQAAQREAAAAAAQKQAQQQAAELAAQKKAQEAAAAAAAVAAQQKAEAAAQAQRQAAAALAAQQQKEAAQRTAAKSTVAAKSLGTKVAVVPVVVPVTHETTPASGGSGMTTTPQGSMKSTAKSPMMTMETPAQVNAARSSILVVEADDAVKAAKYQSAITLYAAALALNPHNQAASLGETNAKKLASGEQVGLLSQTIYNNAILAQRSEVIFNNDLNESTVDMQKGEYAAALNRANDAEATATASRHLFSAHQYNTMLARSRQQVAMVQRQQAMASARIAKVQETQIRESQQQLEARVEAERRVRVNQLMQTANDYYKQQQYQQSLDTLDQVVAIDPQNYTARFMRRMVQDQLQYNKYNHYSNLRSLETQKSDVANEEELIPYQRLLIYPRDWPELSRLREAEQTSSESPLDRKVEQRLDENVSKISATQEPFENVVDLLRNQTGLNIVVNWNALAAAGVEKTTPVSLTLRDVPFKKVLQIVLQQVQGGGTAQLGYSIDEGVITVSTNDQLAQQQVVRVYDIQDLLVQAPNFSNYPQFNLQSATQNTSTSVTSTGGGAGANNGGNLFGGGGGSGAGSQTQGKSKKALVSEITKLIENTVDRNSWVDNGGTAGTVREINGQLVISQTPANQQKISGLLQQLREARAIQISIEARFLLVSTNFLNDFGFGWNLSFPASFFGGSAQPLSISNNTETTAAPQSTGIVGSLGGTGVGSPGSPGNSLDISGGILSNYALNLFLQATQQDVHTTTLTAPRITLFNGQSAYITVAQQQNFVSSFTQTAASGGIAGTAGVPATNLNISTLTTGVVLAVQATVSADHRYVVMTLQPSLSTLDGLDVFNINGQTTGSSSTTNGNQVALPGFVQLPKISLTELATTVSVPDGGTLLIGGQRLVGEVEVESGVPILSKIPIINRLFTNRSFVKDTRVLLILVRPHIIIQKEAEKKQFGQNY